MEAYLSKLEEEQRLAERRAQKRDSKRRSRADPAKRQHEQGLSAERRQRQRTYVTGLQEEREDMRATIEALRVEVTRLRQQLQQLKRSSAAAKPSATCCCPCHAPSAVPRSTS